MQREMASISGSISRGKRAKTSSSMVDDTNTNNLDSVKAAGTLPQLCQTPPPGPPLRRSLRLSGASASGSNNLNPNLSATAGQGNISGTNGSLGKRKGKPGRGRPSLQKEMENEKETETGTGAKMEAGEGRRMTLRSGSQIRVTVEGTTLNSNVANYNSNSSVAAPTTTFHRRRPGRPKRANHADQDQRQQQQEDKELREGNGDGKDETVLEERLLSLRSRTGGERDESKGKLIIDEDSWATTSIVKTTRFMDKGKGKMVVDEDSDSTSLSEMSSNSGSDSDSSIREDHDQQGMPPAGPAPGPVPLRRREAQRNRAIELAPKFAFFKDDEAADSEGEADTEPVPDAGAHDWPGPFSTAMKIIEEREHILRARQEGHSAKGSQSAAVPIPWTPSRDRGGVDGFFAKKPPSLKCLCIKVLADNAHEIESLEALPAMAKTMLVSILCHSRKMTAHHLSELAGGSPVELQLSDCSWATDKEFEEIFTRCDASQLKASFSTGVRMLFVEM
jgi:hypothetical protein